MARTAFTSFLFSVLRVGVTAYVGLCLVVAFRQAKYVYYPERGVALTPAYFNLAFEDLTLATPDGETLGAWFVPSGSTNAPCVLYCHGNAGNIGGRLDSLREFNRMGWDVLIFDYRGYGDSSGKPSEQGTYLDAQAAWTYLVETRGVETERIIIYGRSLGGSVAIWLGARQEAALVVSESSFTSAVDMAHQLFPFLPTRLLCRFKYDALKEITNLRSPVVIAHSPHDETIPFAHGRRLCEAAPEPKLFVQLAGSHNSGGFTSDAAYREEIAAFAARYLPVDSQKM